MNLSSFPRARWFTNRRNIASILSLTLYGIALTVLLAVNPDSMLDYAFIGGLIGLLSTTIVIFDFVRSRGALLASQNLLLFRALSDAGIAARFILYRPFNKQLCGDVYCTLEDSEGYEDRCGLAAGVLQFFESASEAWFVCISFDMLVSLSNPFSSFQDRVKKYHLFVWTYSTAMALMMGLKQDLHGFFFIEESLDDTAFCWISSYDAESPFKINYRTWVFLYIPLFIVFAVSIRVVHDCYKRLRRGISKTFQRRLKAFLGNFKNIVIYSTYWAINMVLFFVSYSHNGRAASYAYKLLFYKIASKGFCDLWIWIWISENGILDERSNIITPDLIKESFDTRIRPTMTKELSGVLGDGVAFNQVLRQEVLYYITTGIKASTQRSSKCKPGVKKFIYKLSKPLTEKEDIFRPPFLLESFFRRIETLDQMLLGNDPFHDDKDRTTTEKGNGVSASKNLGSPSNSQAEYSSDLDASKLFANSAYSDSIRVESTHSGRSLGSTFNIAANLGTGVENSADSAQRMTDDGSAVDDVERESTMKPSDIGIVSMLRSMLGKRSEMIPSVHQTSSSAPKSASAIGRRSKKSPLSEALLRSIVADGEVEEATVNPADPHQLEDKDKTAVSQKPGVGRRSSTTGATPQSVQVVEEFDATGGDGTGLLSFFQSLNIFRYGAVSSNRSSRNATSEVQRSEIKSAAVRFVAYNPPAFRRIRAASGVAEDEFVSAFSETVKERLLTGGASGAFFFFSKDEKYIAKSCTLPEMITIRENASALAEYFESNPFSCIARIYGAYQLHVYGTDMHFYVMQNIFKGKSVVSGIRMTLAEGRGSVSSGTGEVINEKYDIKGSWVDRNAKVPSEGQLVTCSNCNQKYEFVRPESAIRRLNRLGLRRNRRMAQGTDGTNTTSAAGFASGSSNPMDTPNTAVVSSGFNSSSPPPIYDRSMTLGSTEFVTDLSSGIENTSKSNKTQSQSSKEEWTARSGEASGNGTGKGSELKGRSNVTEGNGAVMGTRIASSADKPPPNRTASRSALSVVSDVIFMRSFASSLDTVQAREQRCPNTAHGRHEPNIVLKDNDLKHKLRIPSNLASLLIDQLDKDAKLLCDILHVMDYSLLVGVHNTEYVVDEYDNMSDSGDLSTKSIRPAAATRFPVSRVVGPASYYVGIVDFQQKWTFSKKLERLLKVFFLGADPAGLSAAPPEQYKERFLRRIEDLLDFDEEADDIAWSAKGSSTPNIATAQADGATASATASLSDESVSPVPLNTPTSRAASNMGTPPNVVLRRRSVSEVNSFTPPG